MAGMNVAETSDNLFPEILMATFKTYNPNRKIDEQDKPGQTHPDQIRISNRCQEIKSALKAGTRINEKLLYTGEFVNGASTQCDE